MYRDREEECVALRKDAALAREQWEEMRTSCSTITGALTRYESAAKILKEQEAHHQSEILKLAVSEEKLTKEIERLRAINQELEAEQALLVSHVSVCKCPELLCS